MYICIEWLSLTGLLMILGPLTAAAGSDDITLGPQQNGLLVIVSKKGAHMKVSRQLAPPVSSTTPTPTPTPATATASSTATPPPTPPPTSPATTSGPPPTTGQILIYISALREVDAEGAQVRQSTNNVDRAINSFDNQDFNVTQAPTPQIPNSQPPIPAETLTLDLTLPTPLSGVLRAVASVTKINGSVISGDEVMTLAAGQLEVSAEVDGYQWCDSECPSSRPSMFLDMDVIVQLSSGRTAKEAEGNSYGRPKRYSLGKDAFAEFSTKVYVDHSWRNLTSGYPKLSTSDTKNTLTIRLPRFNTSATYTVAFDPGFMPADSTLVGCASALGDVTVRLFVTVAMVATGLGLLA